MKHAAGSLFVGICVVAGMAFGQSQIGGATISGTVTDQSGAVIGGAKVTATQPATGLTRVTDTTAGGLYSITSIPAGTYDISVEKSGFNISKFDGITLTVGAVATLDVKLGVGQVSETVSVDAQVPVVETTRSQTSTVVDSAAVAELPINGRNFLDFALLTPGVVRDPTRSGDISFGGQRGTANSLQIDGSDSNNTFFGQATGRAGTGRSPYSFSQDAVQEFQVAANTYAPEIGRAGGGVINVITKSGTNAFHGTAFEFFRDKGLNANSWENNRIGAPKRNYHYNQFGGNIGGPVKKDKIFFFFDYDGQRNNEPIVPILPVAAPPDAASQQGRALLQPFLAPYARSLNNDVYLGKADFNLTDSQRLSVRYNVNKFTGVNYENSGATSALGHTGNATVRTDNIAGTHTLVLSPATVLESRVIYTRDNEPGQANSTAPEVVVQQNNTTVMSFGRNNFSPRYTNAKTFQWAEGLSHVRGRHSYKFGSDLIWQRIENFFPGFFSGSYTFTSYANFANNIPFTYTQAFAGANTDGPLSKPNAGEYAFYVQDSWRVTDRLTLNYGARYDLFKYANPTVKNPDAGLAAAGFDTSRINLDSNNLAGRFGFAYKLADRGNLVLRGGIGTFYGRTPSIMTGTAFTQNGIQVQTYTLAQGTTPVYPNVLSSPPALSRTPDIFLFDKNYVQPVTHQWSLNLERQFGQNYAVTIGYLGVRGEHLSRTRDVNLLPSVALTGTLGGAPVTYFRHLGRPNGAFRRVSIFDSGADSIYHGGFIQLSKRLSQNFQVQTSYTFAKVIDSRPDFTSVVTGTDDSKNAQDTLLPNLDRGRGNADIRHRFVFSGIWDIDYAKSLGNPIARAIFRGYQFSLISTLQSGRPISATVGGDPNNDGNTATDRVPGLARNTIETPGFAQVDIRLTRDIHVHESIALRLMFEAFNVTNRVNFNAINPGQYNFAAATGIFTPNATFLAPTSTFDPRILQLAAKITF